MAYITVPLHMGGSQPLRRGTSSPIHSVHRIESAFSSGTAPVANIAHGFPQHLMFACTPLDHSRHLTINSEVAAYPAA